MPLAANLEERIAKHDAEIDALVSAVGTINSSVKDLRGSIDALANRLGESGKAQWGNIFAAIGVGIVIIGAIGTSFISPLSTALIAHDKILTERGVVIEKVQDRIREAESLIRSNQQVHESEYRALQWVVRDIGTNGSGSTRERLAVIESKLKDVKP